MLFNTIPISAITIILSAFNAALGGEAGFSTGSETVRNVGPKGDMYTDNWRQGSSTGTRSWNAAADSFSFTWNTPSGFDQIGRIGKDYRSPGLANLKVDDVKSDCIMTATANLKSVGNGGYMWGVYGWTGAQNGKKVNEIYVMFQNTFNTTPGQSGYIAIGSVDIDGVRFDCVKNLNMPWAPTQNQYMAIAKSGPWSGTKPAPWTGDFSIDLKKVLVYFRQHGLPNEYMVDLTWALEGMGGTRGQIVMTRLSVPDLAASNTPIFHPRAALENPGWRDRTRIFAINGGALPASPQPRQRNAYGVRILTDGDLGDGAAIRISPASRRPE